MRTQRGMLPGLLAGLAMSAALTATASDHTAYLTVSEMEQVCRCRVEKMVTREENNALAGDLNFLDPGGDKILSIRFDPADFFGFYKTRVPNNVAEEVAAVGEEAFLGPLRDHGNPNVLTVRNADHCIKLSAGVTPNRYENRLTKDQLIAIGKIIVSRM